MALHLPLAGLLVFIALKTALDLAAHLAERATLAEKIDEQKI